MAFLYSLVLSMNRKFPLQSTKVIINQGVNAHQNVKKTKTAIFRLLQNRQFYLMLFLQQQPCQHFRCSK